MYMANCKWGRDLECIMKLCSGSKDWHIENDMSYFQYNILKEFF
uniref:Uncharacterized protein n=1 Tax=Anguilla anguilla TaxID=7936 RepID=A0A0E9P7J4_ANGAN